MQTMRLLFRLFLQAADGVLKYCVVFFFFFKDTATSNIYTSIDTLSLHDALPICTGSTDHHRERNCQQHAREDWRHPCRSEEHTSELQSPIDNSYAVFCLKKNILYILALHGLWHPTTSCQRELYGMI